MFVVILTGATGAVFTAPRAVGPFNDYDTAQAFLNTLVDQWAQEAGNDTPTATVVRVEEALPGVVVGEI